MLVPALPEDISRFWPLIKQAIIEGTLPTFVATTEKQNRIFEALLNGKLVCMFSVTSKEGDEERTTGVIILGQSEDEYSGVKNLWVYGLASFGPRRGEDWMEDFEQLVQYARHAGCTSIVAYTEIPRIEELAKVLGFNANYRFLSYSLNGVKR